MVDIFGVPFNLVIPDGGAGGEQGTGAREAQQVGGRKLLRGECLSRVAGFACISLGRGRPRIGRLLRAGRFKGARSTGVAGGGGRRGSCDPRDPILRRSVGFAGRFNEATHERAPAKFYLLLRRLWMVS